VPRSDTTLWLVELKRVQASTRLLKAVQAWSLDRWVAPSSAFPKEVRSLAEQLWARVSWRSLRGRSARLEQQRWAAVLRDLVHVTRNAVDHGLESGEERARCGKLEPPRLTLAATRSAEAFTISVTETTGAASTGKRGRQGRAAGVAD